MRRLRVRSRNRMAALAGRSPHAYALWIERHERTAEVPPAAATGIAIHPLIDCRHGDAGLEKTLRSLGASGLAAQPIMIGGGQRDGILTIASPRELPELLTGTHDWLLPMRAGDELAEGAFEIYVAAAAQASRAGVIYADDDLIEAGKRHGPHFKPDWNPELFEHHDFLTGSAIIRAERGWLADLPNDGWAPALIRSAITHGGVPAHLARVLHHRHSRPGPIVPCKPADLSSETAPSVTAIIPTRDRHELLRTCIEGLERTDYPAIQTIVVDNGSSEQDSLDYLSELESRGVQILRVPGPFNYSVLNNAAVRQARGELLCFLNNDVEMTDPDWLSLLVRQAIRPDIGAVGARLLYPDGTIQHAGVFTGIGGGAGHAHRFLKADEPGYFERARLPQRVSAVTGACMVVARDKFLAAGGFDEERFPVAFNDVDLCLKLNARGWQSFYEPRATLIHHESKSRGSDSSRMNRARFAGELAALKRVWNTDQVRDPYHHPHLSPFCEQFLVGI